MCAFCCVRCCLRVLSVRCHFLHCLCLQLCCSAVGFGSAFAACVCAHTSCCRFSRFSESFGGRKRARTASELRLANEQRVRWRLNSAPRATMRKASENWGLQRRLACEIQTTRRSSGRQKQSNLRHVATLALFVTYRQLRCKPKLVSLFKAISSTAFLRFRQISAVNLTSRQLLYKNDGTQK